MVCLALPNPITSVRQFFYNLTTKKVAPSVEEKVNTLIVELQTAQRLTPLQAASDPLILRTREFLKTIQPGKAPQNLTLLKTELLAARLGLTNNQLNSDPEFAKIVEKRLLYNYIATYNHTVGYDSTTKELLLGPAGNQKPWSEVKPLLLEELPKKKDLPNQPLYYGMGGVHKVINLYEGTKLRVIDKVSPEAFGGDHAVILRMTVDELTKPA